VNTHLVFALFGACIAPGVVGSLILWLHAFSGFQPVGSLAPESFESVSEVVSVRDEAYM